MEESFTSQSNVDNLTTEIMEISSNTKKNVDMTEWPEYKRRVVGLLYLDDYDGTVDESATNIEAPTDGTSEETQIPKYQCIKCGLIQSHQEEIHRIKCTRCFNKAFNKIKPKKWIKFEAY